ncbi:MAG: patatin-like phospholipase family protein, partial [Thermodesulfobacteriota bacterium]
MIGPIRTQSVLPPEPRVGLALGAGTARGFAHVGVLKVIEATGIPIHLIVGTSVGALVGVLYAYGTPAYEIQKLAMSLERADVVDLAVPDNGFVKGEKLEAYVNR